MSIAAEAAGVKIATSTDKGLGVFATRPIAEHAVLGDYVGERLTQHQVDLRYGTLAGADKAWLERCRRRGITRTGNYVFKVDEDVYIDSEDPCYANFTRFLNHGSSPNLRVKS